ncbi:amidohydrolase family protein [Falsiroseomonas oryzae]|uniref:amidohydrolase family protein n=1 Tax=Falsiroseomonas oryzae TaxID=2766473 RepID=UPI0022EB613A|nr:amidohydrolase family protein [Roseomonas sp. MO-31]
MRRLIRCGWLVSMDPAVGDLRDAEILVDGDRIVAIGHDLGATAEEVLGGPRMIAMPGLVNAHLHTWQAGLRGIACEWGHGGYFRHIHADMATRYGPEDNYIGNLVGALAQLDAGVTTLLDYCHNITSQAQAERSIDALEESGIRAVFALGAGKLPPEREAAEPFERRINPRERVAAIRRDRLHSDDARVTMMLGVAGPHWASLDATRANLLLARELGLRSSSHATKRPEEAVAVDGYRTLITEGLVGADHNIVHGNYLDDAELRALLDAGVSTTATCQTELRGYAEEPIVRRVCEMGFVPSIGVDVEPRVSGEMFREMQCALLAAQHGQRRADAAAGGARPGIAPIGSRQALAWATIGGAEAIGLGSRIGSLAPGKRADIVLLREDDLNLWPVHDPVLAIVEYAHAGNVDTVLVDGVLRKRDGRLLVPEARLTALRERLQASARRIMEEAGFTHQPA